MNLHAICHSCKHQHAITEPKHAATKWNEWTYKHDRHDIELVSDREGWRGYKTNADIKISYVSTSTITIGVDVTPLASSATFVLGRESAAQDNGTDLSLDGRISGKITVGTTPTIDTSIQIFAFSALDDTPTWPDVMDGTDSDETLTSVGVGAAFLKLIALCTVDSTTSDRAYPFTAFRTLREAFGFMPQDFGLFITHNTGVALNTTAGNHFVKIDKMFWTST